MSARPAFRYWVILFVMVMSRLRGQSLLVGHRHALDEARQHAELQELDRHPDRQLRCRVLAAEVLRELVHRTIGHIIELRQPVGVRCPAGAPVSLLGEVAVEKSRVAVRPRVLSAEQERHVGSKRDLNTLQGIEQEQAELLVEDVERQHRAEIGIRLVVVMKGGLHPSLRIARHRRATERITISTQAVVADAPKIILRPRPIGNNHSTRNKQLDLLRNIQIWLGVLCHCF